MVFIRQQLLAPLAFRQESFVVLLSITPLLDGVLRLDIIAPFHTSGPPLLQFHLAIEQWGASGYAVTFPIALNVVYNVLSIPQTTASTSNAYWGRFYITALNKNGFNVSDTGAGSNRWIAIGSAQPQWGKTISGNNVKTKFPIAFTAFCMLSVSVNSSNGNAAESVFRNGFGYTNKTLSDWILRGPTSDATYFADYIAIGCQPQWGYYVESQNPTDYRYWSIPFTSHYITMATKTYYEPKEEAVPWLVGIDMQKFICGYGANFIGSSYVSCVGIGCQPQWGTNRTNGIYSFPIPFTEALCCFGGGEAGSGYYDNASAYSNTQVRVYSDGSSRFVSWIAIGA